MASGRVIGSLLIGCGLAAGAAMYWFQVYAFYETLDPADVDLTITRNGTPEPFDATSIRAITSDSSPIRFRACFQTVGAIAGDPHPDPVPLVAPSWFGCFDADAIGADLASGAATAFMGVENVTYGIDRVIVLYPDGRGYSWDQINPCGAEVFDGNAPPQGCPPPPG